MRKVVISVLLILLPCLICAQESEYISIFFWNLENHFHPDNDSLTNDDEFTPEGERFWGFNRYWSKNARLWKTIVSAGSPEPPEIIALVEVENRQVINDLFIYSPPGIYEYEVIHEDSDDWRGIDVALLFDPEKLKLENSHFIKIDLDSIGGNPTRDILYARFTAADDTIDVFVNHWPSKYGGAGITDKFRKHAALTLLRAIDSIRLKKPDSKLLVLGDFNDIPGSTSLEMLLSDPFIIRLELSSEKAGGTIKYQGRWENIDHIIVSQNLLNTNSGFKVIQTMIYSPEFLFEPDLLYGGNKPFRTWNGYKFQEGFSDHLPIILKVEIIDSY